MLDNPPSNWDTVVNNRFIPCTYRIYILTIKRLNTVIPSRQVSQTQEPRLVSTLKGRHYLPLS